MWLNFPGSLLSMTESIGHRSFLGSGTCAREGIKRMNVPLAGDYNGVKLVSIFFKDTLP